MGFFHTIVIAFKAFIKTFRDPQAAENFLLEKKGESSPQTIKSDNSHLRLLGYLQQTSRLVDFLKEDIHPFTDAQIGAAVRKIHKDSAKVLEELVTIRPLEQAPEGTLITIPKGYNPSEVKLVGHINGDGPYTGILTHKGWIAHKISLPKNPTHSRTEIIAPAEVEIK